MSWGNHHPCWQQTPHCGCLKVTHVPDHQPSYIALGVTGSLVFQSKPWWDGTLVCGWDHRILGQWLGHYISTSEGSLAIMTTYHEEKRGLLWFVGYSVFSGKVRQELEVDPFSSHCGGVCLLSCSQAHTQLSFLCSPEPSAEGWNHPQWPGFYYINH